jgi:hypothetical protein
MQKICGWKGTIAVIPDGHPPDGFVDLFQRRLGPVGWAPLETSLKIRETRPEKKQNEVERFLVACLLK